ncbi:MAG: hypothetical protein K0A99_05960 [Desulfoarculaceae bacterium]|nr:hypothetical protein [Desulfoarculaceae bacterium]
MKKNTSVCIVLLFCALLVSACSAKKVDQAEEKTVMLQPLTGIVVMPVMIAEEALTTKPEGVSTRDSVAVFVDGLMSAELGANDKVHIVTEDHLDALLTGAAGDRLAQMQIIGAKLGANAVLEVTVTRFHERDGSDLAVNSPASAAFALVLTHVESGKVLWDASFDEIQEALSSNLFALGKVKSRGFKWITAEELVRQGLKERLADCPYLQK